MIINFRIFEEINIVEPEIGNYILFSPDNIVSDEEKEFFSNNPGKVFSVSKFKDAYRNFVISVYDNPSNAQKSWLSYNNTLGYFCDVNFDNIIAICKTKKDVEIYLDSKKFNL